MQKIGKKLNGKELKRLARFYTFLILERRTTLMKAFIESQFAYCPFFPEDLQILELITHMKELLESFITVMFQH